MEKLHATNFQRVIEEQTTEGIPDVLPANFDVDRYFGLLRQYVIEMHKLGIYHGDLHLRNVMIDRENGTPYIIDFGKSQFENELDKSGRYQKDLAENDFEAIRLAKIQVVNWLKNQQGKAE